MALYFGFSLFECLFILFLISLFVLFAIPNFQNSLDKHYAALWCTKLSNVWAFAKNESMISGQRLWLCSRILNHQCEMAWNEGIGIYPEISGHLATKALYKITVPSRHCQIEWHGFLNNALIISPNLSHAALSGRFEVKCGKIHYFLVSNRVGNLRIDFFPKLTLSPADKFIYFFH